MKKMIVMAACEVTQNGQMAFNSAISTYTSQSVNRNPVSAMPKISSVPFFLKNVLRVSKK